MQLQDIIRLRDKQDTYSSQRLGETNGYIDDVFINIFTDNIS